MLTAAVLLLLLVAVLGVFELRRLGRRIDRLSRARVGVISLAELAQFEDAVNSAWQEFTKTAAIRSGEERFTPEQKASLAVERYRAKLKHDLLLSHLNDARQAQADLLSGRKTLEQISAEFQPTLKDLIAPQAEERRVYQETLTTERAAPSAAV